MNVGDPRYSTFPTGDELASPGLERVKVRRNYTPAMYQEQK